LIQFLESENEKSVAIACYDLGEFCRNHPFGKKFGFNSSLIEKFEGKKTITHKARDKNPQVRETALVAL